MLVQTDGLNIARPTNIPDSHIYKEHSHHHPCSDVVTVEQEAGAHKPITVPSSKLLLGGSA
jgi:hypothetical protein